MYNNGNFAPSNYVCMTVFHLMAVKVYVYDVKVYGWADGLWCSVTRPNLFVLVGKQSFFKIVHQIAKRDHGIGRR